MLTLEMANKIIDSGNDEGIELTLYEKYSGRGMFGKETVGIVAHSWADFIRAVAGYCFELGGVDNYKIYYPLQEILADLRSDNMGYDIIIY